VSYCYASMASPPNCTVPTLVEVVQELA